KACIHWHREQEKCANRDFRKWPPWLYSPTPTTTSSVAANRSAAIATDPLVRLSLFLAQTSKCACHDFASLGCWLPFPQPNGVNKMEFQGWALSAVTFCPKLRVLLLAGLEQSQALRP